MNAPLCGSELLRVRGLTTRIRTADGVLETVNDVSFDVHHGETLAVVGESGSGKTVTMHSIMRLLPSPPATVTADEISLDGVDLMPLSTRDMRALVGRRVGIVFQDPMTALNPVMTIGGQITEGVQKHLGLSHAQASRRAVELLQLVGVPSAAERLGNYPHQFSGGMRQRVMIAMALACDPVLLIADEPTTGLDVTIQAQILRLLRDIKRRLGMSMVWITHDLGVVAQVADRVAVMYAGRIVEEAPVRAFFAGPAHPYSRGLLDSLPGAASNPRGRLASIGGHPPSLLRPPGGCAFAPRCRLAVPRCAAERPSLSEVDPARRAACWRWSELMELRHAS